MDMPQKEVVGLFVWALQHVAQAHPGIDRRPVFLITNDAIVLEPEVTDN